MDEGRSEAHGQIDGEVAARSDLRSDAGVQAMTPEQMRGSMLLAVKMRRLLTALIRADDKMTHAGASDGAAWRLVGEVELLSDAARELLGMPKAHAD
jgi:hypothetical protein